MRYVDKAVAAHIKKWDPTGAIDQRDFVTARLRDDGCYILWHPRAGRPPNIKPKEIFEWRYVKHIGFVDEKKIQTFKNKWRRNIRLIKIDSSQREEAAQWLSENVGKIYSDQGFGNSTLGCGWEMFSHCSDDYTRFWTEVTMSDKNKAIEFSMRWA
jgi:hypothetical protein